MSDIYTIIDYSRQNPTTFTEEHYNDVGPSFTLGAVKRAFLGTGFALRDAPGGVPLTLGTDYALDEEDILYSSATYEDETVYTKVNILDPAYEVGDLYVTYDGVLTYVTHASAILHNKLYGKSVGELFTVSGNIKAPAQFDDSSPEDAFFGLCLDDIADAAVKTISSTNYPDLVAWARAQTLVYLEGQAGEATTYSGDVVFSVMTLDDNAANNALLSALYEDALVHGGGLAVASYTNWLSVTWDGVEYPIEAVNTAARTITVTGSPTAGVGSATFYPHRISGSATTARLFSMQGRSLTGAGMSSLFSGLRRRDQMQRITGSLELARLRQAGGTASFSGAIKSRVTASLQSADGSGSDTTQGFDFDSTDSPDARASSATNTPKATHSPDSGVHIYIHAGKYIA